MYDTCTAVKNSTDIKKISTEIRRHIIHMAHKSKSPHVGSSMSCADILAVLYFDVLRLEPWETRDIFILSKGHAAMALYSTLAVRGIVDKNLLDGYCLNNGTLPAHLDRFSIRGVEVSAGSLGHGFNIGLGMAYGFKKKGNGRKVYALIGDGESQEGSIWEGALFASKLGLDNFTAVMDYNNLQGYGRPKELCYFEPLRSKWEAFGWHVVGVNGHDPEAIRNAFETDSYGNPKIIIASTTKGKGVSFMEDQLKWHYFIVTDERKERALKELV
ncbi:MAG: transketolase [Deferribacteres bacterium]|nr:transketolase [Deferribacteres bacterium]